MERRVLITISENEIAPRFDLTREVLLVSIAEAGEIIRRKPLLLAQASADDLCDLALARDIGTVVCGAIENEHYHYLRWKRIEVIDSVVGSVEDVLGLLGTNSLHAGAILYPRFGARA